AWAERMALAAIKCQAAMECLAPLECPAMEPVAAAMPSPVDRIAAPVALSEAAGVDRKSYPLAAVKDLVQATAAARRAPGRAPVHFPDRRKGMAVRIRVLALAAQPGPAPRSVLLAGRRWPAEGIPLRARAAVHLAMRRQAGAHPAAAAAEWQARRQPEAAHSQAAHSRVAHSQVARRLAGAVHRSRWDNRDRACRA